MAVERIDLGALEREFSDPRVAALVAAVQAALVCLATHDNDMESFEALVAALEPFREGRQ